MVAVAWERRSLSNERPRWLIRPDNSTWFLCTCCNRQPDVTAVSVKALPVWRSDRPASADDGIMVSARCHDEKWDGPLQMVPVA